MQDSILILAFTKTRKDYELFLKHLEKCKTHKTLLVVHFRGTRAYINDKADLPTIIHRDDQLMSDWLRRVMSKVLEARPSYRGLLYYGHMLGLRTQKKLSLDVFVAEVISKVRPTITYFDSCYMADIRVMQKISSFTRYLMASPSFHPYTSILDTKSFYSFPKRSDPTKKWYQYVKEVVSEYNKLQRSRVEPKYTCLFGFDLKHMSYFDAELNCRQNEHMPHNKRRFDFVDCVTNDRVKNDLLKSIITQHEQCEFNTHGIGISK